MKPSREEREKLAGTIRQRQEKSGLSKSELATLADVDPGQTSRILDGDFRTIGGNVLRICKALGVDPHAVNTPPPSARQARQTAAWARLEASVRRAWDETPQDADRLVAVIDAVAKVKAPRRGKASSLDVSVGGGRAA